MGAECDEFEKLKSGVEFAGKTTDLVDALKKKEEDE